MAYREVTMVEIKELLLLWMGGAKKKRIATQLSLDVKTVRRFIAAAESSGLTQGPGELTDEQLGAVLHELPAATAERERGESWQKCESEREEIARLLKAGVRLSKVRRLLQRRGIDVPYPTLHRFAVAELDFGKRSPTIPVADGKPGEEIHIDTGWMTLLEPDERGRRRRFRAWIFTPHVSRYRFVYPTFSETTEAAIEEPTSSGRILCAHQESPCDRSEHRHPEGPAALTGTGSAPRSRLGRVAERAAGVAAE